MARVGAPREFLLNLPMAGRGCLIWPYARNSAGYANIRIGGKNFLVSRVVCRISHGPQQSVGDYAAHSCGLGHTGCIAPWHVSWKSPKQNTADMLHVHRTTSCGSRHPGAKLTESDVRKIRTVDKDIPQPELAAKYGICRANIGKILQGKIWRFA